MTPLARETQNIQNPALGSALLWRFASGFVAAHPVHDPAPLLLAFLVAPIVLHERTEEFVHGTYVSSGLRVFAGKFGKSENCQQDLLLSINRRAISMRAFTLESLSIGIATRLIHIRSALVLPLSMTAPRSGISTDVRRLMTSAEKIGAWFALLSLHEISTVLKVRF